jgi:hypothetical protein
MRKIIILFGGSLLVVGVLLSTVWAKPVSSGLHQGDAIRSPIQLLPGYKIQLTRGIDSLGGRIWKSDGLDINFEVGVYIGNIDAEPPVERVLWREEQTLGGRRVVCIYTKENTLDVVLLGNVPARFYTTVRNQQDIVEVLLMALTFDPINGYESKEVVVGRPKN